MTNKYILGQGQPETVTTMDCAPVVQDPVSGLLYGPLGAVSGAGKVAKARIAFVGNSLVEYGGDRQQITITSSLFPFGGSAFSVVCISWANGSGGTGTLTFSKSAQTLRWAAPGETAGPAVDVSRAGRYTIPGLTPSKTITVVCRPRMYSSATEGDFSVTTTAGTSRAVKSGRTVYHWALAKCRGGFEMTLLANGGSIISDITESMSWQLPDNYFDAVYLEAGTNDLSLDRTLAQMQADMLAQIAAAKRKAPIVFLQTLLPRSANMTASRRQTWSDYNRWVMTLRSYGVIPVNASTPVLDPDSATAAPGANTTDDGLHYATYGAELASDPVYRAIADVFRFDESVVLSSQVDVFNASTNPTGNALPSGGTFTGTGGTLGSGMALVGNWAATTLTAAGVSVITGGRQYLAVVGGTTGASAPVHTEGQAVDGTVVWKFLGSGVTAAFAAGWDLSRESGTNIIAAVSKAPRPDGRPGFVQRLVISNPGAGSERVALSTQSGTRPAISVGQVWNLRISQTPVLMVGVELMSAAMEPVPAAGEFTSTWGANAGTGTLSGSRSKLVMEPWPLTVPSGPSSMNTVLRYQLAASGYVVIELDPGEQMLWRDA